MKNKMFYIDKNETIEDILKQIKEFFEYDSGIVCDDEKVAYFKEDTFNQLLDYITNLQEENRQTKLLKENYQLKKEVYKQRIDKAIEYIKTCNPDVHLNSMFLNESYISNYGANDLLNILNGGDEE